MRSSSSKGKVVTNSVDAPVENGLSHKERLPTIQIDTVPSPPWSPTELSTVSDQDDEEPLDAGQIDLQLDEEEQARSSDAVIEELRESLRSFVEEILSKAMVVAEKKLQFVGVDDDEEDEEENDTVQESTAPNQMESQPSTSENQERRNEAEEEAALREAAARVVEEVLALATEQVSEQMEQENKAPDFPIKFDDAPEDVRDAATNLIKEIVGKAIAMAEEKALPTTVPFNFEDVDLIKTSGPWYIRVREGFMRVLRTACFCTPRRHDS